MTLPVALAPMSRVEADVAYDRFFSLCGKAYERFGSIFDLPVDKGPYECLRAAYLRDYPGGRVLDFGCGAGKPLKRALGLGDDRYHSCDSDRSGTFTYASPQEIPEGVLYEIVAANQVFEHLDFADGIRTAVVLARHVARGGILQIGVPNPDHPTRFLSNPTHLTPWNYVNLCALLELSQLQVSYCARTNKARGPRWWERPLVDLMCRVFRMDWCDTVYAVGRRCAA